MKKILIVVLCFFAEGLDAQELKYLGHGKIEYKNKVIKKPRKIKEIMLAENSPELMSIYRDYVTKKRLSQFFTIVGGFGLIYSVEDEFGPKPRLNWRFLGLGISATVVAESFSRPSNKALKSLVDEYNFIQRDKMRPY